MAKRTIYCVQAYGGRAGRLVPRPLQQFGSAREALQSGERLSPRVSGVVVFRVSGEPDFDQWDDPEVLVARGQVPRDVTMTAD